MEVIIQPTAAAAARLVARLIARELRRNPRLRLGLATGQTMQTVYADLVDLHRQENLDFAKCLTFNLDEYVQLSPTNPQSYRYYMNKHLFEHINIRIKNTHLPNGMAQDLAAECARYEKLIARSGGIDYQLLGIGQNGHIGFNEPLSGLFSRTREQVLAAATIAQNGPLFGNVDLMPRRALTMGIGTILDSKRCVLLATGATKADAIAGAVEGPITAMLAASALQLHPHCIVVVDAAAGAALKNADRYREVFNNEPQWAEFR